MTTQQPVLTLCELGETTVLGLQSYSPFCLKVHRALGATGLTYASRHGRPDSFRGLNPAGQVPILLVGDDGAPDHEVLSDSTRIVARVEELSVSAGGPSLLPTDARARAEAWLWEDYADRALNGFVVAARWGDDRNWPLVREAYFKGAPWPVRALVVPALRRRVVAGLVARDVLRAGHDALWSDYRRVLDHLEARAPLEGFWLGTEAPTLADVSLFGQLQSLRTPLTAWQAREVTLRPALTDWLDRVDAATFPGRARPATPDGLTAPRGHDMTPPWPSRTPTHARA
jgi:glutathione S-transferase